MIKILIILMLCLSSLIAGNEENNLKISGVFNNLYYKDGDNKGSYFRNYIFLDYKINEDISFHNTIKYFKTGKVYNSIMKKDLEYNSIYLVENYIKIKFDKGSVNIGKMPINKGFGYAYGFDNNEYGTGIAGTIDVSDPGILVNYKNFTVAMVETTRRGLYRHKDFDKSGISSNILNGTQTIFAQYRKNLKDNRFYFNYYNTHVKILNSYVGSTDVFSFGYAKDRLDSIGDVWYIILSMSYTEENAMELYKKLKLNYFYNVNEDIKSYGYMIMTGYKKYFDFLNKDFYYGIHGRYLKHGYKAYIIGKPNETFDFTNCGIAINLNLGMEYNKNLIFNIFYGEYYKSRWDAYPLGIMKFNKIKNENINNYGVGLIYKF